jgi:hypothetical protein
MMLISAGTEAAQSPTWRTAMMAGPEPTALSSAAGIVRVGLPQS